jgi:hypothetical protein
MAVGPIVLRAEPDVNAARKPKFFSKQPTIRIVSIGVSNHLVTEFEQLIMDSLVEVGVTLDGRLRKFGGEPPFPGPVMTEWPRIADHARCMQRGSHLHIGSNAEIDELLKTAGGGGKGSAVMTSVATTPRRALTVANSAVVSLIRSVVNT